MTIAIINWLKETDEKQIDLKNLLQIVGIIETKKKVKWSEEIDKIIYVK